MFYVYLLSLPCLVFAYVACFCLFQESRPKSTLWWASILVAMVCQFFAMGCALMSSIYFSGVR